MQPPSPLQLYVHIPFCIHKCHYCDFNSHERAQPDWQAYQQALITELQHWAARPMFAGRKLSTIFFGGGTPSLAPPELIKAVIDQAISLCGLEPDVEISLEANPGTADSEHFKGYKDAGVNRLSIGVQSLDTAELHWLERIHGRDEAIKAYHMARQAGFDNINLDLMYGLPGQDLSGWLKSLQSAIKLGPEHLSCYQLTVEPHTKLAATHAITPYALPDDDTALSMFYTTREQLSDAGYAAYEISNFCKPELKCRHNDGYWKYHDYIGIGAGASGKWDGPSGGQSNQSAQGITRYSNIRTPERYIAAALQLSLQISQAKPDEHAINSQETLNGQQAAAEAFWLGLRRTHGINRAAFKQRFGFDAWQHFYAQLQPWQQQEQLSVDEIAIYLPRKGLAMADAIAASVL